VKRLYILFALSIFTSCGGGGGSSQVSTPEPIPFSLTIGLTAFSVDEDSQYSGSLNATANETVTITYSLISSTSNGTLDLSSSGEITYTPDSDFFGSDQFQYSVTAEEKNVTKTATVNITINYVNDEPEIGVLSDIDYSKDTLIYNTNLAFNVRVTDSDSDLNDLSFDMVLGSAVIPGNFSPDTSTEIEGDGILSFDLSSLQRGGLYDAEIRVFDGNNYDSVIFNSWFAGKRRTITIQQDVDPTDGFEGGQKVSKDYEIYYLSGGPDSSAGTKYLFVGDSLNGEIDINLYRRALLASVNKLNDSDASEFFNPNYFTILSAEPIDPDGSSPFGIRTGCADFDETIYCIGEMDTDLFPEFLPGYEYRRHLISVLTRIDGRGVNSGNKNIQKIREADPERTSTTLMHELGHAHGSMGDEYRNSDGREDEISYWADRNPNTTTQSTISLLKWKHHIEDHLNVLGKDVKVCYNWGDGSIQNLRTREYIDGSDCACLVNEWREYTDENGDLQYEFIRKNPECAKVGLFEGNYFGEFDNYRPTFCSIMDSCSSGGYGPVNVEGFAVGSIHNQGFYDAFEDVDFGFSNGNNRWNMTILANYDTSKITLKWYVNGEEQSELENQKSVSFNRPAGDSVQIYTAKAVDLTGTITSPDDILDNNDFYEGIFQSNFTWCADYDQSSGECNDFIRDPNPSQYNNFDYGYMNGPLGFTWGINWSKW
jgi:hypothetical protein